MTVLPFNMEKDNNGAGDDIYGHDGKEEETTTKIELATLVIPSTAHGGITPGDGSEFILETSDANHIIVDDSTTTTSHQHQHLHGGTTCATIEGVIDLDVVVGLIDGVTGEEFVDLLHTQNNEEEEEEEEEDAATEAETTVVTTQKDEEESIAVIDENMPLLPPAPQRPATTATTTTTTTTEGTSIALSADPFLETLAHAYPPSSPDSQGNFVTQFETTNNVAHEAFLISIPVATEDTITAQQGSGDEEDIEIEGGATTEKYVLALPEIDVGENESEMSHTNFPDLVRKYSTLPTDIQYVELLATTTTITTVPSSAVPPTHGKEAEEEEEEEQQIHLDLVIERKVPIIGYVILISGLFALASVGAALDLQGGDVTPTMKCFWRLNATSLALLPLAFKSLWQKNPKGQLIFFWDQLSWKEITVLFPLCSFCYMSMTTAFVIALDMTSLANAFILSNLTSLVIIFSKAAIGIPILLLEGSGAVIGLGGALVCTFAPSTDDGNDIDENISTTRFLVSSVGGIPRENIGDLIAFLASVGTAVYLVIAKNLRPKVDLFVFMFFLFLFASIFLLMGMAASGEMFTFSMHPDHGVFGWMVPVKDRLPLTLYMAIVCNIIGTTGYIAVMKYFSPVVVSMVMLSEPVIAAFLGVITGVDSLPGTQVWIGDAFVMLGSVMVIYSGSSKTETIDATKSLMTTPKPGPQQLLHTPLITPKATRQHARKLEAAMHEAGPASKARHMHTRSKSSQEAIVIWD